MSLPISLPHARQLAALRNAAPTIRVVVVGAAALGHHLPLLRDTKDVDLALAVAADEIEPMLVALGWTRDRNEVQRWNGPAGFRADVVPAAPELIRLGEVRLDGGARRMSLVGFDLAFEQTDPVELPGTGVRIDVARLMSLVVLKMVAFLDRPHQRARDLGDLDHVLRRALDDDDDRRWAPPLLTAGVEFAYQSAYFVGREVAAIARPGHRAKIDEFVDRLTREDGPDWATVTVRETGEHGEGADEKVRNRWREFRRGFAPAG